MHIPTKASQLPTDANIVSESINPLNPPTCCPRNLYNLSLLLETNIGITLYQYRYPFLPTNTTPYLMCSKVDTKSKLTLNLGTYSTSGNSRNDPESSWNITLPNPFIACMVPAPHPTWQSKSTSVNLSNTYLIPIICPKAPLSKYQALVSIHGTIIERDTIHERKLFLKFPCKVTNLCWSWHLYSVLSFLFV